MSTRALPTDPRVIRVLLRYREAVAQATEQACRDLERLGVDEPFTDTPEVLDAKLEGQNPLARFINAAHLIGSFVT